MMDTVLNLGINDAVADGMLKYTKNPRFVFDTYRRFVQMFGTVVLGIDSSKYEDILTNIKTSRGVTSDIGLNASDLLQVVQEFKGLGEVPDDPWLQLSMAIEAVFSSWFTPRLVLESEA